MNEIKAMKGLLPLILMFISLMFISRFASAQVYVNTPGAANNLENRAGTVRWISGSANDVISFQNGTGALLVIQITVDNNQGRIGVNVSNCGTTTHINSGSTAICVTKDASNPVSFVTDNANNLTSGVYSVQLLR